MAEGTEVGTAYVSILPSAAGFGAKLQQQITGEAASVGQKAGQALGAGITGQASGIAKSVAGVFAVVGATKFLKGSIAEAEDAARVGRLTEAVIKSTGGAAGVTAAQVEKLATNLSKVAGVDDEVIQGAENVLLTFRSVSSQVFPQATKAALDMSAALGTDLQGSVIQLGKALNDPIQGMTALRRVGVSFTEQQQAQIKALQQSGDLLGAQKLILAEVNSEFGGAAAAGATSTAKLGVAVKNLEESLGTALLPVVNATAGGLTNLVTGFTEAPGPIRAVGGALVLTAGAFTATALAVGILGPKVRAARAELEGMGSAGVKASGALGFIGKAGITAALTELAMQLADKARPAAKDLDKTMAELADTTDGKLNKAFHDTAETMHGWIPFARKAKDEFDTFNGVLGAGNFALAQRIIASEGDAKARAKLQALYDTAISQTRQLNTDQALSATIITGVGDAVDATADKVAEAKTKWDDLSGTLSDLIATDWSKTLGSNFESALNPLAKFTFNGGKDIAGLKDQVASAKTDLDKANADLAKIVVTGTAGDIARIRGQAGGIDAARAAVDQAAARFNDTKKKLAEAQKSPLASITDNLNSNLAGLTSWLANFNTLSDAKFKGGHESLAKHLAGLGPEAAGAMAEALGLSPKQLDQLQALWDKADAKVAEISSGQFELNADQAGKPGETLAQIISDRYQKTLLPKFMQATLAALNQATAAILGTEGAGIPGAGPEPGPGEARPNQVTPPAPAPALGPPVPLLPPGPPLAQPATPGSDIPGGVGVTINVHPAADTPSRQIAGDIVDQAAWRLAPAGGRQMP